MKSTAAIIVALVLLKLYLIGSAPAATPAQAAALSGDAAQWAADLAHALGNSAPSPDLLALLIAWQRAEGSAAAYNPLATTQDWPGATCFNAAPCVKNYPSYDDGLAATVQTLVSDQPGYAAIVTGIQTNDPQRIIDGIAASPWGTSAALTAQVYNEAPALPPMPAGAVQSTPIAVVGDVCAENAAAALLANNGALLDVTIAPGATWSFNQAVGDPRAIGYGVCAGVPGGNWCNLAARYAQVARALGAELTFQDHGVGDLGAGPENSVAIWNIDGTPGFADGRQDLIIRNTTGRPMRLSVSAADDRSIVVVGG